MNEKSEIHQEIAKAIHAIHQKYDVRVTSVAVDWLETQPKYIDQLPSFAIGDIEVRSRSTINKARP